MKASLSLHVEYAQVDELCRRFRAFAEEEGRLGDEQQAEQRQQAAAELAPAQRLAEGEPSESARAEQVDPFEDRERVGEREEDEGEVEAQPGRSADLPRAKETDVIGYHAGSARLPPLGV